MRETPAPGPKNFATTHWSLVKAAQSNHLHEQHAQAALEQLCRAYWFPLYAFLRQRGYSSHNAQDLTQSFLARFIESRGFASANPNRGRFRTYLLGCLKHFLINEWNRAKTKKRGGEIEFLEWDALDPEARYALTPRESDSPETRFDREWAGTLVQQGLKQLRQEYAQDGKEDLFTTLQGCLTGEEPPRTTTATQLGIPENTLKVVIHRLRRRYRDVLREIVADTVHSHTEIEDEMRYLVSVLRNNDTHHP